MAIPGPLRAPDRSPTRDCGAELSAHVPVSRGVSQTRKLTSAAIDARDFLRAAPFRRSDDLLNLLPKGVIAFLGSGIIDNLVDNFVKLGILV